MNSRTSTSHKCESNASRSKSPGLNDNGFVPRSTYIVTRIIVIIICILFTQFCSAQFIPYSQYYNTPLLTNPSLAGQSDYTQLSVQYKKSRVANYEIPSVSFVRPFFRGDGLRAGGIGINVISQQAGPGRSYKATGAFGTFAYTIHLNRNHHISAGLQAGMVSKKLDPSGITTDNQYNFGVYDPTLPTGENIQANSVSKAVINSGFNWTLMDNDNVQKAVVGIAFFNMNKPSYELTPGSDQTDINTIITGEVLIWQNDRASVHPGFRYIMGAASIANIGSQVRYRLMRDDSNVGLGLWYKTSKAWVAAIQYSNNKYIVSASMDFSSASNLQANIHNAVELSLGWRLKRKGKVKQASTVIEPTPVIATLPELVIAEERQAKEEKPEEPQPVQPVEAIAVAPEKTTTEKITPVESAALETKIAFDLGSTELTPESAQFIETQLIPVMKNHPDYTLHITGHSCTTGDKAVNEKISLHRAEAIAKILVSRGVPAERIVATGMDFQNPIASNTTEEGRKKNRRVEFELVKESGR